MPENIERVAVLSADADSLDLLDTLVGHKRPAVVSLNYEGPEPVFKVYDTYILPIGTRIFYRFTANLDKIDCETPDGKIFSIILH